MTSQATTLNLNGLSLSALRAEPVGRDPIATVLALPGGGHTSAYWHHPVYPDASLLKVGSDLGYRVLALDRPGYGLSARPDYPGMTLDEQAKVVSAAVETLSAEPGAGAGVFLVGHSMGGIISLLTAANHRLAPLLGLDVSGVPFGFSQELAEAMAGELSHERSPGSPPAARLFYGPRGTFDPRIDPSGGPAFSPPPEGELMDSIGWPSRFEVVAGLVDRPVRYTIGVHDRTTDVPPDVMQAIGRMFIRAPRIVTEFQVDAGHNISLHYVARAFHLGTFKFFDEVIEARTAEASRV